MAITTFDISHTSKHGGDCKSTVMIISHTDADGVVSALVNRLFARLYTQALSPNILTIGSNAPGSETTMSCFKYGLAQCMNNFGKGFSNDELIIIVCDRDFFKVKDYEYIKETYGKYTKRLRFICMDHHATNILINDNYFIQHISNVDVLFNIETDKNYAGCNLSLDFWKNLINDYSGVKERYDSNFSIKFEDIESLVLATRNWDTFIWRDMEPNDQIAPLEINSMNNVLGPKLMFTELLSRSLDIMTSKAINNDDGRNLLERITDLRKLCKEASDSKIQEALDNNLWNMHTEIANLGTDMIKIGMLFGVDYNVQSMFAQKVFEMDKYYDLDVIAFVNYYGTVSVRIREGRETILNGSKLGTYAREKFGTSGGGHANACGFTIDYNVERKTELGQKTLDAIYGALDMPAPPFKIDTK